MERGIQIFFIFAILVYLIVIIHLLRKDKLNLKYTLLWLFSAFVLLVVTIFPQTIYLISNMLGIKTPINSAIVLASMFIIMILIMLTSIVSRLNKSLRVLIQEVALLEKKVRDLSSKEI